MISVYRADQLKRFTPFSYFNHSFKALLHTLSYPHRVRVTVSVKGCVRCIFGSLFLGLNESTSQMKKNVFCFTSKTYFVLEKIEVLNSTFSNFMTSSNA